MLLRKKSARSKRVARPSRRWIYNGYSAAARTRLVVEPPNARGKAPERIQRQRWPLSA
jgi:hypothetical protein